jgi:hypothetical protein
MHDMTAQEAELNLELSRRKLLAAAGVGSGAWVAAIGVDLERHGGFQIGTGSVLLSRHAPDANGSMQQRP